MRITNPEAAEQLRQAEIAVDRAAAVAAAERAKRTLEITDLELAELVLKRDRANQTLQRIDLAERKIFKRRERAKEKIEAAAQAYRETIPE